jgi:hypothetical protein
MLFILHVFIIEKASQGRKNFIHKMGFNYFLFRNL